MNCQIQGKTYNLPSEDSQLKKGQKAKVVKANYNQKGLSHFILTITPQLFLLTLLLTSRKGSSKGGNKK